MDPFSLCAPAKLNLFLHITGRRADGYHELQSVFQLLEYGDTLDFSTGASGQLQLRCTGPFGRLDVVNEDNLVMQAAQLLREYSQAPLLGARITLHKRLPSGGGLGGGSSDAATALLGLNRLWSLNLDIDTLSALGKKLGADVPVFVRGHSAWAEGIGDELTPVTLPEQWFVVVHPGCHVSTPGIFSHAELTRDTPAITMAAFFAGPTHNDCENVVRNLYKPVDNALIFLGKFGSAQMTGTGACVFAAFAGEREARDVAAAVPESWYAFVAKGVNRSPAHVQLDAVTKTR